MPETLTEETPPKYSIFSAVLASRMAGISCRMCILLTVVLFCSFVAVTDSEEQDTFYFDPPPFDKNVREGEEVRLRCDVSDRNHIRFSWELDNKALSNSSRRFQEDSDLRILRVDRQKDTGAFRCIATNVTTGVSIRSRGAILDIQCEYYFKAKSNLDIVWKF